MYEVVKIAMFLSKLTLYLMKGYNVFCVLKQTGEETGLTLEQGWFRL